MSDTYLVTAYADKDQVKALGARWDPARRQWRVPAGMDLAPFAKWLPQSLTLTGAASTADAPISPSLALAPQSPPQFALAPNGAQGIPLSRLLNGVALAVSEAFRDGVWTIVEIVDVRIRQHVYLELAERDLNGNTLAKAPAMVWAHQAQRILPQFQQATGVELAAGLKLLVRARPVFKAQYGFSLEIDAIDPHYTLGDLEANKRDIRERLSREGLFQRNRELPPPWDFNHLLVVAPEGGAGLGDFQAEASRLERHGLCQFTYVYSRFQGEGAAQEIRQQLLSALEQIGANHPWQPDAVVLIRGGGAVNDLAWLNDYALARCLCELPMPVFTGIGHERDNTVLDEVAQQRFDTPSKVIAGIEHLIRERALQARALFESITQQAQRTLELARLNATQWHHQVQTGARGQITQARSQVASHLSELRVQSAHHLRLGAELAQARLSEVKTEARAQLFSAQREVPALISEVRAEARQALRSARLQTRAERDTVTGLSAAVLRQQKENLQRSWTELAQQARQSIADAREGSTSLMREITGQGPSKTLSRGFAVVRSADGEPITSAASAAVDITLQFHDGQRAATLLKP